MPSVNGFWAVCDASVSITFSSCTRSSWTASFMLMSSTSIEPGHIKASDNRSQITLVNLFLGISREERSSPYQSLGDYTTITAEVLELFRVCYAVDECLG